jgi:hypothetical protein
MTPIPPRILKRVLEKCGYRMIDGDNVCWLMESNGQILVIPQTMELVPEDVLEGILGPAEITAERFMQLIAQVEADEVGPASAFAN